MSILSTTNSGLKYFSTEGIINRCCELTLNGEKRNIVIDYYDDGSVDISPNFNNEETIEYKLFTKILNKDDCPNTFNIPKGISELYLKIFMLTYMGNRDNYVLTIKESPDKKIKINNINCNVVIANEIKLSDFFDKTKIHGSVTSKIYDEKILLSNNIHPYFGKDVVGY